MVDCGEKERKEESDETRKLFKTFLPKWHIPFSSIASNSDSKRNDYALESVDIFDRVEGWENEAEKKIFTFQAFDYVTIGRTEKASIELKNELCSRCHAIIVYSNGTSDKPEGIYLIDCGSTNGSYINQNKIESDRPYRIRNGYIIKFGFDSHFYIVKCPEGDQDEELEISYTEMRQILKNKGKSSVPQAAQKETIVDQTLVADNDNLWGQDKLKDSVFIDSSMPVNYQLDDSLYAQSEEMQFRIVKNFFNSILHIEPQYECKKEGKGLYACQLKFHPFSSDKLAMVVNVSAISEDKARQLCALEACKIIDAKGFMSQELIETNPEQYEFFNSSDSGEDEYFDQTGQAKAKYQRRIDRKEGNTSAKIEYETFESCSLKYLTNFVKIQTLKDKLRIANDLQKQEVDKGSENVLDSIEEYMQSLKQGNMSIKTKSKIKTEIKTIETDNDKSKAILRKLKPIDIQLSYLEKFLENPLINPIVPPKTDHNQTQGVENKESNESVKSC